MPDLHMPMLAIVIALAVLIIILILTTVFVGSDGGDFFAALIVTASAVPLVAVLATVIAYIAYRASGDLAEPTAIFPFLRPHYSALIAGGLATLVVWPVLAILYRPFTRADRAHANSYNVLCSRFVELRSWLDSNTVHAAMLPMRQAERQAAIMQTALGLTPCGAPELLDHNKKKKSPPSSLAWALLTRYNELFGRLHRAEQALIEIDAPAAVVAGALRDASRLEGSNIPGRDD